MKSVKEILDIINHAHGTEAYHKFSSIPFFPVITDGVLALADVGGCYWFLDIIGSYQTDERLDPEFQVWKLEVNHTDSSAIVTGYNDATLIIIQEISFTDFPLDELKLYVMDALYCCQRSIRNVVDQ